MPNNIAAIKNYTSVLDAVYQKASVSGCLTSGGRMVRAGKNAKEIMIPKISVSGLGDYTLPRTSWRTWTGTWLPLNQAGVRIGSSIKRRWVFPCRNLAL